MFRVLGVLGCRKIRTVPPFCCFLCNLPIDSLRNGSRLCLYETFFPPLFALRCSSLSKQWSRCVLYPFGHTFHFQVQYLEMLNFLVFFPLKLVFPTLACVTEINPPPTGMTVQKSTDSFEKCMKKKAELIYLEIYLELGTFGHWRILNLAHCATDNSHYLLIGNI